MALSLGTIISCKRGSNPNPNIQNSDLRDTLANYAKFAYYWNTLIPSTFNPHNYSAQDTFYQETNAIKSYSAIDPSTSANLDRFSFVLTENDYQLLFVQGSSTGYGMEYRFDENGVYRIRYAAHASPAYQAGVRRGWEVDSVNGVVPSNTTAFFNSIGNALNGASIHFAFKDGKGIPHSITIPSATIADDEVVTTKVLDTAGKKIGYMVYNTFLPKPSGNNLHPGLDTAFQGFANKGITDIIIDLRYNGGGYVSIVENMANALIPASNQGKTLFTETFNANLAAYNTTTKINKSNSSNPPLLNINSVNFIVSEGTASASELIINSLLPYFSKVKLIGVSLGRGASKQKTAGKPFGFFNQSFPSAKPQYEAFLINDETKNALGQDNYTAGFVPDIQVYDGVEYDWGSPKEYGFAEAIHYLVTGSLAYSPKNNTLGLGLQIKNAGFNLSGDNSPIQLNRSIGLIHSKKKK